MYLLLTLNIILNCPGFSIDEFEQVNTGWETIKMTDVIT